MIGWVDHHGISKWIRTECCDAPVQLIQDAPGFQMDMEMIECASCGRGIGVVSGEWKFRINDLDVPEDEMWWHK